MGSEISSPVWITYAYCSQYHDTLDLQQSAGIVRFSISSSAQSRSTEFIFLFKARSHGAMCDCDLLYQEMECCLRFSDFVHKVRWVWMRFSIYLHWNHTLQPHRMGVEPNHVWHHTYQCIARTWNPTIWTPSLTSTQSIFCIAVANKKIAPCERAFNPLTVTKRSCLMI